MKQALLVLSAAAATLLSGCAAVKVAHTDVASGAVNPKAIYIRSYMADDARFKGNHGHNGQKPIRKSLAPAEFSVALREQMEKMAPSMVLKDDEEPTTGWLVESNLEWIHAGSPVLRASPLGPLGAGRSYVRIHVRITDIDAKNPVTDAKKEVSGSVSKEVATENGPVIYEFDLKGGSRLSNIDGSIYAPGFGYATPFDYRNAAERVMMALSIDPHKYGARSETTIR